MNKKKNILFSVLLVSFILVGVFVGRKTASNEFYDNSNPKQIKEENTLSMMIEQTAGTGDYKMEERSSWPTEGYKFNATLSKCANGGELSWDDTNKVINMTGNMSDKCYIYFDIFALTDYVKLLYTGTQGENSIYYHDNTLENGAGDNSYRYAGASDVVNNYVCFGYDGTDACPTDNLYRIIGVFDNQVKLIKATAASSSLLGTDGVYVSETAYRLSSLDSCPSETAYINENGIIVLSNKNIIALPWDIDYEVRGCNKWNISELNTINLNTNYLNNIGESWSSKIAETTWKVGGNTYDTIYAAVPKTAYTNEITNPVADTTYDAKIGLIYVSDYYYAASSNNWSLVGYNSSDATADYRAATTSNWMYLGSNEWTITPLSSNEKYVFIIYSSGYVTSYKTKSSTASVRPVFYLDSLIKYMSGSGISSDPIVIE